VAVSWRTDFPGGNGLLLAADESPRRPVLRFAAEPKNCPQALWFHFRAAGLAGRGARVVLANPAQTLGGEDWSGNCLVFRTPKGPWLRTARPQRLATPGGRTEWAWDIDVAGGTIEVAHCFPYQPADLEATLAELGGAFKSEFIGLTLAGRSMTRLYSRPPAASRPAVLLTARHHAGEVPGSWVLDGLLRHVAATSALRAISWHAIPFVDLDDVIAGSYGKDPFPHDCNRAYGPSGPFRPEGGAVEGEARRLKASAARLFFADLHAPGHGERANYVPTRGWEPASPINPIAFQFAERFCDATPEDIRSPIAFVTPRPGTNTRYRGMPSSRWAGTVLKVDAVSLEFSYQGNEQKDYTIDDYRRLGAALAETIAGWIGGGPERRE